MQTVAERNRLEALEKGLREVKDRVKRLLVLSEGSDTQFWKALSGELFERDRPETAEQASALIDRIEADARAVQSEPGEGG